MFFTSILNIRFLAVLALAFVAATAAYGHAASNSVTSKAAGDGSANISGYTVGGSGYTLNSTNPDKIDIAKFDVTGSKPATVKLQLVSTGAWFDCTTASTTSPYAYTCGSATAPLGVAVSSANQLRVVAAE